MKGLCNTCNKEMDYTFRCKFCNGNFCENHQLPENHSCKGLDKWKEEEIGKKTIIGKKNFQYQFRGATTIGYYPKSTIFLKIRKQQDAEDIVLDLMHKEFRKKLKNFEGNIEFIEKQNIWSINGEVEVRKFIGSKKMDFTIKINAINGEIIEKKFIDRG